MILNTMNKWYDLQLSVVEDTLLDVNKEPRDIM